MPCGDTNCETMDMFCDTRDNNYEDTTRGGRFCGKTNGIIWIHFHAFDKGDYRKHGYGPIYPSRSLFLTPFPAPEPAGSFLAEIDLCCGSNNL